MYSRSTVIAIFTFFVLIAVITGELINDVDPREADALQSADEICSSPECTYAATRILKSMNFEAKPCDHFYEFVCGNYMQSDPTSELDFFTDLPVEGQLEVDLRLQRIIQDIDEIRAPKAFADIKISYGNCVEDELNTRSNSEVDASRVIANSWKSLSEDEWDEESFDPHSANTYLFKFLERTNNDEKTLELVIKRSPIHWGHLKEGTSNPVVQAYSDYMTDIFIHLGVDDMLDESDLKEILSTETELAKILFPENENRDIGHEYTRTTVGELHRVYPELSLKKFLRRSADSVVEIKINGDIIGQLGEWIVSKSKRALAFWIKWRWTMNGVSHIHCSYNSRKMKMLFRAYYEDVGDEPKWRKCVQRVRSESPFLLDVLYYGQYISRDVVEDSLGIYAKVKQQFIGFIEKFNWFNDSVKKVALAKVEKIKNDFGIYEKFMLVKKVDTSYCDLKLSDGLLRHNRVNVTELLTHFNRLSKSNENNKGKWNFVQTIAKYIQESILLAVGAVSYTENFYNIKQPNALNYGAFGYLIGQQFAHSLDDANRLYDGDGVFKEWWNSEDNETFIKRTQCFVEQYRNYGFVETGIPLKSITLLNDHIAENVGIKLAYFAYDQWSKDQNKTQKRLPGLDYSPRQMFWISKANSECPHIYRAQYLRSRDFRNVNSLEKLPLNIALSNMPEFAKDFECSTDSKMNPASRCTMW